MPGPEAAEPGPSRRTGRPGAGFSPGRCTIRRSGTREDTSRDSVAEFDRRLHEKEEQFRQLADSMPHLVWTARPDGTLEYFNQRWFEVTGLTEAETFAPGGWQAAVHPEDVSLAAERWAESVRTGQPFQVEVRYKGRPGALPRWQLVRALPGRDDTGRIIRWYGTVTDVDVRKRVEEALRRARDEMEVRVAERTADLVRANEALRSEIGERAEAERHLRRQSERLRVLHEIDRAVLAARSSAEIAQQAVVRVRHIVPCERTAVILVHRETDRGEILAVDTEGETRLPVGSLFSLGDAYLPEDAAKEPFLLVQDLSLVSPDRSVSRYLEAEGVRSHLAVPLVTEGKLLGFLTLGSSQPQTFDTEAIELARQVAVSLTVAIHSARLFEEVKRKRGELQTLLRRLVEVREEERRNVARELHDEAGQALTSLMVGLGLTERELAGSGMEVDRIAELKASIDGVLERLHGLAVSLRPASLDRLGLAAALRQALEAAGRQSGLDVRLTIVGLQDDRLPAVVEAALFHALSEAVTNVVRHAEAGSLGVVLERRDGRVLAIIEDDGRGFDADETADRDRLGLVGMREWVEMVGGSLTVEAALGRGTTIYMEVPCGDTNPDRG